MAASWWSSSSTARSAMFPVRSARTGAWRNRIGGPRRRGTSLPNGGGQATRLEFPIGKRPNAEARKQDLVLGVGHRIADILIQQIVPDQADDHFARAEPERVELGLVADFSQ